MMSSMTLSFNVMANACKGRLSPAFAGFSKRRPVSGTSRTILTAQPGRMESLDPFLFLPAVLPWYLSSLFCLPDSFLQLNDVEGCSDLEGSGQSLDRSFAWRDCCVKAGSLLCRNRQINNDRYSVGAVVDVKELAGKLFGRRMQGLPVWET